MYSLSTEQVIKNNRFACLDVANQYLHGTLGYGEAKGRLHKKGSFGRLLIGEIALEEANIAGNRRSSLASSYVYQAREYFSQAFSGFDNEPADSRLSNQLRAGLRIAQLDVLGSLVQRQKIPTPEIIESMYGKVVRLGASTLRANRNSLTDRQITQTEVKGVLSEMAILALTQRHAVREAAAEGWLPVQSLFSEDHGGDCRYDDKTKPAWDMTIFTQYHAGDPLEATYKVQAKTSLYDAREDGEVSTISIMPDLQLMTGENSSSILGSVLLGCEFELDNPDQAASRLSAELDQRTSQIFNIID